jgi:quinoprotein dehydrogenase-associated probable ABC transporter substrate-binding protein
MRREFFLLPIVAAVLAGVCGATPVRAQTTGELVSRTELRVCADPNNLPFSNTKSEGFENKIAALLGKDFNLPVSYVWYPQVVGFIRNTLAAHRCDLVMGTVAGDEMMQTTTPYYYTSYVMVYRSDKGLSISGFDDPKLKSLTIGIVAGTPPTDLLLKYKLADRMRSYALVVDTRFESPTHEMIQDIASGKIDVGLLWGPIAGFYVRRDKLPMAFTPLKNEPGMPRVDYHIAMGVRPGEPEWRRQLNAAIVKDHDAIVAVLKDYGVPLLDEQGNLVK